MRATTKVHLSVPGKPSVEIGGGTKNHANLKNLSFEESGHTGFQSELSNEQLKNIADVPGKENLSNKVTVITEGANDKTYPTAKAVYDFTRSEMAVLGEKIEESGEFELIKSGTTVEDAQQLSWSGIPKCKEFYIYFRVPTLNPDNADTSFPKGRIFLYNAAVVDTQYAIYYEPDVYFVDDGNTWCAGYHIKMCGKRCVSDRMYNKNATSAEKMYAVPYYSSLNYMGKAFGKKLDNPYIEGNLTALMYPTGTRYFPTGTEYEIWGVKA